MRFIRDILREHHAAGRPPVSCEFFPAKTPAGETALKETIAPRLKAIDPAFFSVTYGAGGSTRDQTLDIVQTLQQQHGVPTMAHLTCVGSTRADIGSVLDEAKQRGIDNILALRGDPPPGVANPAVGRRRVVPERAERSARTLYKVPIRKKQP